MHWPGRLAAVVLAAAVVAAAPPQRRAGPADRVLVGGRVWTGLARPYAQAVAIKGDRLLAVGTTDEVRRLVGPTTTVLDLHGRFVTPGFNDAHLHFLIVRTVDLTDALSVDEIQARIRAYAAAHRDEPWVTGRGWVYGAFPGGLPHRRQLDAVVSDRPSSMTSYDGHTTWANPKAR